MPLFLPKLCRLAIALAFGVSLAMSSVVVQREGPELAPYGNLCGPPVSDACLEPVLNGGFPFAFLFDSPGVSSERQLAFAEDRLRPLPLALNVGVYSLVWALGAGVVARRKSPLKRAVNDVGT